jgi:hypothetical protein
LSEFRRAVADEFGDAYGAALTRDLVLGELGDRSADAALAAGVPARAVWLALCRECDVPVDRRHGVGLREPR